MPSLNLDSLKECGLWKGLTPTPQFGGGGGWGHSVPPPPPIPEGTPPNQYLEEITGEVVSPCQFTFLLLFSAVLALLHNHSFSILNIPRAGVLDPFEIDHTQHLAHGYVLFIPVIFMLVSLCCIITSISQLPNTTVFNTQQHTNMHSMLFFLFTFVLIFLLIPYATTIRVRKKEVSRIKTLYTRTAACISNIATAAFLTIEEFCPAKEMTILYAFFTLTGLICGILRAWRRPSRKTYCTPNMINITRISMGRLIVLLLIFLPSANSTTQNIQVFHLNVQGYYPRQADYDIHPDKWPHDRTVKTRTINNFLFNSMPE